jgi:hypothetical protein
MAECSLTIQRHSKVDRIKAKPTESRLQPRPSLHTTLTRSARYGQSHIVSLPPHQPKERREEEEEGTESSRDYAAIYRLAIRPVEAEADLPFLSGVRLLVETSTELLASSILEEPFVLPLPKLFPSLP